MDYPRREQFFAMRFLRLLTKSAAAMHIGADGCMLLMIIVGQEDACRYTRPVSFWNHQLSALMGLRGADEHALRRVRDRCVRAGWLQYRAGNKQLPASYFVTIPAAVNQLPDSSSDESPEEYSGNNAAIQAQKRRESGENPARIRQESGENPAPSIPSPTPYPIPIPPPPSPSAVRPSRPPPPGGSGGARSRIQGIDREAARQAVEAGDALACVSAFRGSRGPEIDADWLRDAAGLMVGELATVLWLAHDEGTPIRMPSGLRPARAAWASRTPAERRGLVREAFDAMAIPMPPPAAQPQPEAVPA